MNPMMRNRFFRLVAHFFIGKCRIDSLRLVFFQEGGKGMSRRNKPEPALLLMDTVERNRIVRERERRSAFHN
ncbi:hypothetical protein NDS46_25355 [Paenibacillus thiaminolyticus]|uniref:hypothetical protein n=1 Tax=Paenibacillus thiaminolyticus TaxID=49283 RepID=UPI00232E02D5|nr:hypothetical protein [Paenibacillus thiaminolyticus]WCF07596.1 hypothetical protein NDS46_25355 [Paenibacillus thiaminolyticus]